MYEKHFGFKIKPFALTPDPSFLYRSRQHAMAVTLLEYGLESQAAFSLLTGDVGSGKTTLVRHLLQGLGDRVAVGLVSHTHGNFASIHSWALSALGIAPCENTEIARYTALVDSFVREYAKGKRTLLIIDEAQNLSVEVLEELRLLSNVNSERDLVLQILLVGQPELRAKLSRPELSQFAQRVSVDFHLKPLDRGETHAYVQHRLEVAGGSPALFTTDALEFVYARTKGVPRLVNQLCDYGLLYAFADGLKSIDADLISEVLRERGAGLALSTASPSQPEPRKAPIGIASNGAA
jgi:general secretion pathway protein A